MSEDQPSVIIVRDEDGRPRWTGRTSETAKKYAKPEEAEVPSATEPAAEGDDLNARTSDTGPGERKRATRSAGGAVRGSGPAEPEHPGKSDQDARHERNGTRHPPCQPGDAHRDHEVDRRHWEEADAGLQRVKAQYFLHELGGEEEEPDHRAQVQEARHVGAGAAAAREQPQRHDWLGGFAFYQHEREEEYDAGAHG